MYRKIIIINQILITWTDFWLVLRLFFARLWTVKVNLISATRAEFYTITNWCNINIWSNSIRLSSLFSFRTSNNIPSSLQYSFDGFHGTYFSSIWLRFLGAGIGQQPLRMFYHDSTQVGRKEPLQFLHISSRDGWNRLQNGDGCAENLHFDDRPSFAIPRWLQGHDIFPACNVCDCFHSSRWNCHGSWKPHYESSKNLGSHWTPQEENCLNLVIFYGYFVSNDIWCPR